MQDSRDRESGVGHLKTGETAYRATELEWHLDADWTEGFIHRAPRVDRDEG